MNDETKEIIKEYQRLSSLYFNAMLLISGGIVGILALNILLYLKWLFIIMALWFDFVCISRHITFNNSINTILKGFENDK